MFYTLSNIYVHLRIVNESLQKIAVYIAQPRHLPVCSCYTNKNVLCRINERAEDTFRYFGIEALCYRKMLSENKSPNELL